MARRNKASTVARDRFVNRKRGIITFSGDASVAISETFNTGMNIGFAGPLKWIITYFFVQPDDAAVSVGEGTDISFLAQLSVGTQTAILDGDDMQVITTARMDIDLATSGAIVNHWPLRAPIMSPIPVFANQMSVVMDCINEANFNSKAMYYEIGYFFAPMADGEMREYLAAFGQV